jgi:hypothetical protein
MKGRRFYMWGSLGGVVLLWVLFFIFGHRLATAVTATWSSAIARIAKGKVASPVDFVYWRMCDALWLGTLAVVLVAVFLWFLRRQWVARITGREMWVFYSVLVFVCLNVWVGFAMQRPLFWALLYSGEGTSNYTQFKLKETLTREGPPVRRAILLGSSQTRAQIDENILNSQLANQLWTTELHFPGSTATDVALVTRHLGHVRADFVIVYISEGYFFSGTMKNSVPYFASFRDVSWFRNIGANEVFRSRDLYIGLLGNMAPLFRCRESLTQRILGTAFTELKQAEYNEALDTNLVKRAEETAKNVKRGAHTALEKRAFERFLQETKIRGSRVLILAGQLNPVLGERIDPTMRPEMLQFLHEMGQKYSHMALIDGAPFLANVADDYQDLTHITPEAQERFTVALADLLRLRFLPSK